MTGNDGQPDPAKMGVVDLTGFHLLTEDERVAKAKELLGMIAPGKADDRR
jgi:hypothetical protein